MIKRNELTRSSVAAMITKGVRENFKQYSDIE
jgi:hypothetical protein